jgi:hypothetical protein
MEPSATSRSFQVPRVLWFINRERLRGISVINNNAKVSDSGLIRANRSDSLFFLIKAQITARMASAHWEKISLLAQKRPGTTIQQ